MISLNIFKVKPLEFIQIPKNYKKIYINTSIDVNLTESVDFIFFCIICFTLPLNLELRLNAFV